VTGFYSRRMGMKKHLLAVVACVSLLGSVGAVLAGCEFGSDSCGMTCDNDEDCGDGYLCYSDGLCDNEDHNCGEESK